MYFNSLTKRNIDLRKFSGCNIARIVGKIIILEHYFSHIFLLQFYKKHMITANLGNSLFQVSVYLRMNSSASCHENDTNIRKKQKTVLSRLYIGKQQESQLCYILLIKSLLYKVWVRKLIIQAVYHQNSTKTYSSRSENKSVKAVLMCFCLI